MFDRIKPDITSLPEDLIGAVVDYYLKSGGLNAILTDQRSDFYRLLSLDRAEQLWNQVATLAGETVRSGEHTKIMLDMRIRAFKRNRIVSATLLAAALVLTTVGLGPGLIRTAKALQPCPQSSNGADNRVHGAVHLLLGSNIVTSTVDV